MQLSLFQDYSLPVCLDVILAAAEKRYIESALAEAKGQKKRAADLLGMKRTTLVEKMKRYGMPLNAR